MPVLIVGAGFAGAVYARKLAEHGHSVTLIDSRSHIGGNAFDYVDPTGVRIHKYGPHLLHTNNQTVVEWLRRFGTFTPYEHSVTVQNGTKFLPLPISRATFEAYYDRRFASSEDLLAFLDQIRVPDDHPRHAAAFLHSSIGVDLTDLLFRPYTKKMWGCDLEQLDASVVKRIPIKLDYEYRYFPSDLFQLLPEEGYAALFEKILDHDRIYVSLGTSYEHSMSKDFTHTFSSAAIDEHYGYRFGELPYRSIKFSHHSEPAGRADPPTAVVNYSDSGPFTRETHWHMFPCHHVFQTDTVIKTVEMPCDFRSNARERYYPVNDAAGLARRMYEQYKALAADEEKLTFVGRCGTYQYLDMHQVINQSLAGAQRWLMGARKDVAPSGRALRPSQRPDLKLQMRVDSGDERR